MDAEPTPADGRVRAARAAAAEIVDPELPMVTVADLGMLRGVWREQDRLVVSITPTYSGCPAIDEIRHDVARHLADVGFDDVEVRVVLVPAWTTDWITTEGRRKLAAAGVAPPAPVPDRAGPVPIALTHRPVAVSCPLCGSVDTDEVSRFGSTACKALYRCGACDEPFEYVKPF